MYSLAACAVWKRTRLLSAIAENGCGRKRRSLLKCVQTHAAALKSTYPGVAQLVARLLWEYRGCIRDRVRRNAAKPCDTCVCGIFPDCRKRHKSGFDHRNDHRQKKLYFYRSPWYHGRNWISGYSEVGIAPGLGPGDRAFEPHYSDQNPSEIVDFRGIFLFFVYCGANIELVILNI